MAPIAGISIPSRSGLLRHLPRGRALPDDVWWRRHRGILILLWLHVPAVFGYALLQGVGLPHAVLETSVIVALAGLATASRPFRQLSMVITAVGLLTCSAELVHLSHGLIEMHFHYFVLIGVITLYQSWRTFLVAIGYVVVQHGIAGAIDPAAVYNHPEAIAHPWQWAGLHGTFILAMSVAGVISWRLNEVLLDSATEREARLAEAQSIARLGSWSIDLRSNEVTFSRQMGVLFDAGDDWQPSREAIHERIHPDDRAEHLLRVETAFLTGDSFETDFRVLLQNGELRWLHGRGQVTGWSDGRPVVVAGTAQDITQRRQSEDAMRAGEAELRNTLSLLNATLDATFDGILVVDGEGHITSYNRRFVEIWDVPLALLEAGDDAGAIGSVIDKLADPETFVAKVRELYSQPDAESYDTLLFKDGRVVERHSRPQRVAGDVVGRVWSFRDVTERKRLEDELAHQAFHDSLTNLANQALFRDRVEHALARVRTGSFHVAVLFLDLDNFKTVNDSLGHPAGDELLVGVTKRLQSCLRAADTAARLGGDEFAVLIEDTTRAGDAIALAVRILAALHAPFSLAGHDVVVGASIGIAHDGPGIEADQLLRNADLAMYTAKTHGKSRYEVYAPEMHATAVERLALETELRRAISRDELRLQYQPIVTLSTSEIRGFEALVRWEHPTRGLLSPDRFIPLAEECGLIDEIGRWVLEHACAQARTWQLAHPERPLLSISVNLSPRQLRDEGIVDLVAKVLQETGLPPAALTLEITETAMMHDAETALVRLTALRALGVRLAVDDFGTGYSSLSHLQRFPIDELKIDRSFVQGIDQGPEESSLARAIVRLARTLRMDAVAEGIENPAQLDILRSLGCENGQGFHLCRPADASVIDALLAPAAETEPEPVAEVVPASASTEAPEHQLV
jgi:diguanylate cyclase (GGDEF)-like protein/PAS domain S-box-containing protein